MKHPSACLMLPKRVLRSGVLPSMARCKSKMNLAQKPKLPIPGLGLSYHLQSGVPAPCPCLHYNVRFAEVHELYTQFTHTTADGDCAVMMLCRSTQPRLLVIWMRMWWRLSAWHRSLRPWLRRRVVEQRSLHLILVLYFTGFKYYPQIPSRPRQQGQQRQHLPPAEKLVSQCRKGRSHCRTILAG